MPSPLHPARLQPLNRDEPRRGDYVLYWMQQSQRCEDNHALEHAVGEANRRRLPLVVGFGLTAGYPEATRRHYRFLLEGLRETAAALERRGIAFVARRGAPDAVALQLAAGAALVVADRGDLRHQRAWRRRVAAEAGRAVVQVEGDVVVPVEQASDKREYAARTLRPKLRRLWDEHLVLPRPEALVRPAAAAALGLDAGRLDLADPEALLDSLGLPRDTLGLPTATGSGSGPGGEPAPLFPGGTRAAKARFARFLRERFATYAAHRGQPHTDDVSYLSMALHFGQVSPVWAALQVRAAAAPDADRESFLDELLVRRELAHNFVAFAPDDYDRYDALPGWARRTLEEHADDPREHLYTPAQLEAAATHDPAWNAAMREMRFTGYLHNHMRMYWGKQILAWSPSPEAAHATALELNNRHLLDGRDASSYANVGWLFGLHDRPWGERPVFGTVRSMTAGGLKRKADPAAYVAKVDRLVAAASGT